MKVSRPEAISLFYALGFTSAEQWGNNRMGQKFAALADAPDLAKRKKGVKNKNLLNLLDAILTCVGEDKSVTVEDEAKGAATKSMANLPKPKKSATARDEDEDDSDGDEEEEESEDEDSEEESDEPDDEDQEEEEEVETKKSAKKGKKSEKPSKNGKAPAPKRESVVEKDPFGNRIGTSAARINAVILKAKKPLTAAEIEESAKAPKVRVHGHMSHLIENGFASKTDDKKFQVDPKFKAKFAKK